MTRRTRRAASWSAVVTVGAVMALSTPALAAPSGYDFTVLPDAVGGTDDAWQGDAAVVGNALVVNGTVTLDFTSGSYPVLADYVAAQDAWENFFTGSSSVPDLDPSWPANLVVDTASGSSVWIDVHVMYANAPTDPLAAVTFTCELPTIAGLQVFTPSDCSDLADPDAGLTVGWQTTGTWTVDDPWLPPHTYAAGNHLDLTYGSPYTAYLAGISLRSDAEFSVQELFLWGKTFGFATTPDPAIVDNALPADTEELLDSGIPLGDGEDVMDPISEANKSAVPVSIPFESDQPDEPVDIYAYSTPVKVGSGVARGGVVNTTVNLSSLQPGPHHLVAVGVLTGTVKAYGFGMPLAETGTPAGLPLLVGLSGALVAAGAVLVSRRGVPTGR